MILYNVTIKIIPSIKDKWIDYMKNIHIPEVMATEQFSSVRVSHLLEQNEEEGITFVYQYTCDNLEQYNNYIAEYAPALREDLISRFKDQFVSFRTIMEVM